MTGSPRNPSQNRKAKLTLFALGIGSLALVSVAGAIVRNARGDAKASSSTSVPARNESPPTDTARIPSMVSTSEQRRLELPPITAEQRKKGYHECYPPDPLGFGPYAPPVRCGMGALLVPERGGHTQDFGYDVLLHFNGAAPTRKALVQVARGIAFVGVDLGMGSGKYSDAFKRSEAFPALRHAIEVALKKSSGQEQAHIRHLALSAWSAGYGAVNEILKHGDSGIDAVVLLDALHAGWNPKHSRDGTVASASGDFIAPTIEFARRALKGEKIFVFTHSYIDPVDYPSTSLTAKLLLQELGVNRQATAGVFGSLNQDTTVNQKGLHVWSFRGHDELTHCAHISLIGRVLSEVVERAWDTPAMDRSVQNAKTAGSPL